MKITTKLLTCDTPSPYTGRVYPREEVEKAIKQYQQTIDAGIAFGELGIQEGDNISLSHVSHKILNIYLNDNTVYADIELLDTPAGASAAEMLKADIVRLSPVMYGVLAEDNTTVNGVSIVKTAIVPKEDIDE